ncbi:MAG: HypC/HybG/HupF family hydrogenase formation chaperone [Solirubrobacteraceae bacterium]
MTAARSCRVSDREFDASRTRSDDEVVAQHCITCGDDGVPMTVVRIDEVRGLALCQHEDGARETVETALVDPVAPGDVLLVHAGTALTLLEPAA